MTRTSAPPPHRRWTQASTTLAWASLLVALLAGAAAWAQSMGGFLSPGELSHDHAKISGVTDCLACHEVGAGVSADRCMVCHDTVRDQVKQKKGFHADKGKNCESCHPDHRGVDFELVRLDTTAFDHAPTGFPLRGAHGKAACEDCHTKPGTWTGLSPVCVDCHGDDDPHNRAAGHARLADCGSCHGESRWNTLQMPASVFDHNDAAQADFALEGQHAKVACEDCHEDWKFAPVEADACTSCHDDLHHKQFDPRPCETCHTVERADFALRDFDHTRTDWPLSRPHRTVRCEACHGDGAKGVYVDLPHERCSTCHADPHDGQFAPRDCVACHGADLPSFALSSFDHDTTDFALVGAHQEVTCEACHGKGPAATFTDLPFDDCASCHEDAHAGRFKPATCDSCHTDGAWDVATFDHARTDFPLTGAHVDVTCESCHGQGDTHVLAGLPYASCSDCHADDDPHGGSPATASCTLCHRTEAWAQVDVPHAELTGFPLEGKHTPLACAACHDNPAFAGAEPACASCHEADRPVPHFEGDCGTCHLPQGWAAASLGGQDHATTGFALHGAHGTLACGDCHHGEPSLGPFCTDCHADDDPHRNLLGNTCESCHGPLDWSFVRFAHATTGWPLRGAHAVAACVDCHPTGYVGTPTDCRRCHEADKPRDTLHSDPLTATCDLCHRPYAWEPTRWPEGGL